MGLTLLDDLILAVPLAIVMAVALYMRRYMRSVSDFLAASRCAGRYLICSSSGELNAAVIGLVTALETFSQTGASMDLWNRFSSVVFFLFTLFGVISFRFRETRCLTFHQFLEVRYSKSIRILASSMNIFSALINFGLVPAVGGRFFVYFCDLPENCFHRRPRNPHLRAGHDRADAHLARDGGHRRPNQRHGHRLHRGASSPGSFTSSSSPSSSSPFRSAR